MMNQANRQEEYVRALRREFHRHPEPSWGEERTASRVEEELDKMGIAHKRIAKTGVVAWIHGDKLGKTVALRADMDALEIVELNDLPFKSEIEGMMHGCGHDGHVAMLLGAAKILQGMKAELPGTVKLIFQPAEEYVQGAKVMIEEGCLEGVDAILGIHLWADLPTGTVSLEPGPRMASSDNYVLKITGKGGHGALPHQTVDAVVVGAAIVRDLQTIASRKSSPWIRLSLRSDGFQAGLDLMSFHRKQPWKELQDVLLRSFGMNWRRTLREFQKRSPNLIVQRWN